MSEARKYHLNLIVANQFTTQLSDEIRDAVFGNMGTIVSFRVGQNDVEALTKYYQPLFGGDDLLRVPNYNTIVRTLIQGVPTQPFSMATLPPLGNPNPQLAGALKQLSAAKYGRPQAQVEAEIFDRLATEEDKNPTPAPAAGPAPARPAGMPPMSGAPKPAGGSSFLDDWLAKRQAPTAPRQAAFGPQAAPKPASPAAPAPMPAIGPAVSAQQPMSAPTQAPAPVPAPAPQPTQNAEPAEPVAGTANISSNSLQKEEVTNIADEIRSSLNMPAASTGVQSAPTQAPAPVPAPMVDPIAPKQGEVTIDTLNDNQADEDTIIIDKDGTFHNLRANDQSA
jgi:hypothetical protein